MTAGSYKLQDTLTASRREVNSPDWRGVLAAVPFNNQELIKEHYRWPGVLINQVSCINYLVN